MAMRASAPPGKPPPLLRAAPSPEAMAWMDGQTVEQLFATAVTEAEIRSGVAYLPDGARRRGLAEVAERAFGRPIPAALGCDSWRTAPHRRPGPACPRPRAGKPGPRAARGIACGERSRIDADAPSGTTGRAYRFIPVAVGITQEPLYRLHGRWAALPSVFSQAAQAHSMASSRLFPPDFEIAVNCGKNL